MVAEIKGPKTSDPTDSIVVTTEDNPNGVICMAIAGWLVNHGVLVGQPKQGGPAS